MTDPHHAASCNRAAFVNSQYFLIAATWRFANQYPHPATIGKRHAFGISRRNSHGFVALVAVQNPIAHANFKPVHFSRQVDSVERAGRYPGLLGCLELGVPASHFAHPNLRFGKLAFLRGRELPTLSTPPLHSIAFAP